jgi:hypothetical protein
MKILFLSQGRQISDHPGWHDGLVKLKHEGIIDDFVNIPYLGYAQERGWAAFFNMVIDRSAAEEFDVVYFHYYHNRTTPSANDCISCLRKLPNPPIILASCGDGFSDNWMATDYPNCFKKISCVADITFSTQMGRAAQKMKKWGAKRIVYCPNGICQVRFNGGAVNPANNQFDFDIVFIGSKNIPRYPNVVSKHWWAGRQRIALVNALHRRYGSKFGLFGKGWDARISQGPIAFNEQLATLRRSRIVVGGNPYSFSDYYSSNRIFMEVASGIPTVEIAVPRLDKVLRNNDHVYYAKDFNDIISTCDRLLNLDHCPLYMKAGAAADYVKKQHTQYHRMKFKLETAKRFIEQKSLNDLELSFFLPEVNLHIERAYAVKE